MNNKKALDVLVVGFALFSMFFGAGNLLFPPYLGLVSGDSWIISLSGFILTDIILALVVVMAAVKFDGDLDLTLSRAGKKFARAIIIASILCIGPLLAIPRNGATTYEMGIMPLLGDAIPIAVFAAIFFILTYILTIKPSKVVDIVGQFLTPALLIALAILIVKGIISPLGEIRPDTLVPSVFAEGINQGYQTMDTLAATVFSTIVIVSIMDKGYDDEKLMVKATIGAGAIAVIGMGLVYGGLCYLGATVSTQYGMDVEQTALIVTITEALLGQTGKILLAIIVALACLTTSIGLTSAAGRYFSGLTNGKLKYEHIVVGVCVFSAVISNFGVSTIIKFSAPILSIVYPATITLIILSLFGHKIKNDNVFKCATYMALLISVLTIAGVEFIVTLPGYQFGFNWILPVAAAAIIGNFIPSKKAA